MSIEEMIQEELIGHKSPGSRPVDLLAEALEQLAEDIEIYLKNAVPEEFRHIRVKK